MATVMIDLKRLGDVKAPAGFAERVLAQAGMADSYAVFDTVLGPVYVAWNRLGVSAAMRSKSSAEFESWFRKDVGRQLVRVDPPADLAAKKNILTLEGVQLKRLQQLARAGFRYEGVRSTKVFCFPTCYHGRAAKEQNIVQFHSEEEAYSAGYRPCKHCRPAVVA